MPPGKLAHIVSFSTEDPKYPASNLLKSGDGSSGGRWKWKCKEPGEPSAWVIVQLDKVVRIVGINFGNESSAFVEISVGRSGSPNPEYKNLCNSIALMSPGDSRGAINLSRVKSLASEDFVREIGSQKWDLVRFTCSQPFNRHLQYGLSFIEVRIPDEENGSGVAGAVSSIPKKIGSFSLRAEPLGLGIGGVVDDDDLDLGTGSGIGSQKSTASSSSDIQDPKRIGAFFAKRMAQQTQSQIAPTATSPAPSPVAPTIGAQIRRVSNQASSSNGHPSSSPKSIKPAKSTPVQTSKPQDQQKSDDSDENVQKPVHPKKRPRKTKPFSQLFSNVTFVMSGYQNPRRSEIRRKAFEMGAKCLPDWNSRCTHLVCAFINTPKFRAVRNFPPGDHGNPGIIVTEKWIEDCYRDKMRFPWRRYALDPEDKEESESEDEIWAEEKLGTGGSGTSSDRKRKRDSQTRPGVISSSSSSENEERIPPENEARSKETGNVHEDEEAYRADTDVDDEQDESSESDRLFKSQVFYFYDENDDEDNFDPTAQADSQRPQILKLISNHNGQVEPSLSEDVTVVLTPDTQIWIDYFTEALSENPNLSFVHQSWILDCVQEKKIVPLESYIVKQK